MGRTLNLVDHLIAESRRLLSIDQPRKALALLLRLAKVTEIPLEPAAEGQRLLGAAYLKLSQYRLARRHLRRAVSWQPKNAAAHHLLARAIVADPNVDAAQAAKWFRRAIELDPSNPRLLSDAGVYFGEMGRWRQALVLLEKAVELAPDDIGVLQALVNAMCEAERFEEAQRAVRVAKFRFRAEADRLGDDVEFRRASHEQQQSAAAKDVLPFLRVVSDEPEGVRGAKYRRDAASKSRPHLPRAFNFDTRRGG